MSPGRLTLFNHLGRLIKDLGRNRDAELLSRLEIDDQLELLWLLYGKIGWLRALEDLVNPGIGQIGRLEFSSAHPPPI